MLDERECHCCDGVCWGLNVEYFIRQQLRKKVLIFVAFLTHSTALECNLLMIAVLFHGVDCVRPFLYAF